jgi:hypothetical protein
MAGPVEKVKVGQVELCQWAGEFEGKPTTSYSLKKQKFNKTTKKYEDSTFLTVTDLKDIMIGCQQMLLNYYQDKSAPDPDSF